MMNSATRLRPTSFALVTPVLLLLIPFSYAGETVNVSGHLELLGGIPHKKDATFSTVVVWLTPLPHQPGALARGPSPRRELVQKNKSFEPHLLVIPVGSVVDFPNHDPWFHNVFSLFEGKRFDLGLYEAGTSRRVHFDRAGVSYIFCNIHSQMSAIVIALGTPFYGVAKAPGTFAIPNVPPGRYRLEVWNGAALPEKLSALSREVTISDSNRSLGEIRIRQTEDLLAKHKNKYGREYENPDSSNPIYSEQ